LRFQVQFLCESLLMTGAAQAQAQRKDRVATLLEELSSAAGPSDFEGTVRAIVVREFRASGLEVSTDGLGSVIGVLHGSGGTLRSICSTSEGRARRRARRGTRQGGRACGRRPGHDVLSPRQHPGDRRLRDCYALGVCLLAQFFDEVQVLVQAFCPGRDG
jgi:hypothetical protein